MKDKDSAYYHYLLTSEVGQDTANAHREIVAKYFWDIFNSFGCKKVLDVGCGLGFFIGKAVQGVHAFGIDSNVKAVEHCVKSGNKAAAGRAAALSVADHAVEGILCSHLLEHLSEPEKVFAEFSRVLKSEGVLIVRVPPFDASFYDDWSHVRPFTKKTLLRLAAAFGFQPIRAFYYHYTLPFRRWQNPFFKLLNYIRQAPIVRSAIDGLIRLFGLPPKELVLVARKSAGTINT